MKEEVTVVFNIVSGRRAEFLQALQKWDEEENQSLSFRAGDEIQRREALAKFVDQMEIVLRKHDHKGGWRNDPIEMLVRRLKLELAEFDIAYDFHQVEDARRELVDLSNFCLIVWDRMGVENQK